jgi:N-acetylmuramoyl-L-alanine amidase
MKSILTIHCTMTGTDNMTRRDVDRRDRQAGYAEIGYHYVIARDGSLSPGRDLSSASIHDEIAIAKSAVSIVLVGGPEPKTFTIDQRDSLSLFILNIQRGNARPVIPIIHDVRLVIPGVNTLKELIP